MIKPICHLLIRRCPCLRPGSFKEPVSWARLSWLSVRVQGIRRLFIRVAPSVAPRLLAPRALLATSTGSPMIMPRISRAAYAAYERGRSALQVLGSAAAALDLLPRGAEQAASGESCG